MRPTDRRPGGVSSEGMSLTTNLPNAIPARWIIAKGHNWLICRRPGRPPLWFAVPCRRDAETIAEQQGLNGAIFPTEEALHRALASVLCAEAEEEARLAYAADDGVR